MRGRMLKAAPHAELGSEEQELLAAFARLSDAARRGLIDFLRALG